VIRRKSTDADKMSKSSEPASSTRRENINERVARLLATVPKLEFDNIDMEEYNIDMVEVLTYRKRPYCCVKRPETADTENSSDSSESIPSAVVQRANINERVARLLATVPKLEFDNIDMEEDNIDMEEILTHRKDHIVV
jgi:BRCT domain type II-containing protein